MGEQSNIDRARAGQVWESHGRVYRLLADPEMRPFWTTDEETGESEMRERLMVRAEPMPLREVPEGGLWIDANVFPYMRLMVPA